MDKDTSLVAKGVLYCSLCTVALALLLLFFTVVGAHQFAGLMAGGYMTLSMVCLLWGLFSFLWIAVRHKYVKGFLITVLALVINAPGFCITTVVMLGVMARHEAAKQNTGEYNLVLLGNALKEYAQDHDGVLPDSDCWCDALMDYDEKLTRENFLHPKPARFGLEGECHFAFNSNLSKKKLEDIAGDVVLLVEADGEWNLSSSARILKTRNKEPSKYVQIFFVDGSRADYWFHKEAVRKFDEKNGIEHMYYEQPRWEP